MATTPNYGWILPTVGSDVNVWGTVLNNFLVVDTTADSLDTVMQAVSDVADAAMPLAGGVFVGDVEYAAGSRLVEDDANMGALEADWALGNFFSKSLANGAQSITFANYPSSGKVQFVTLLLTQGGSGNSTVTWPTAVEWQSGIAPTLSTIAGGQDILTFFTTNGGSIVYGAHAITDPS